ncbi:hypothetical protein MBANPS3_011243 [Mucor bainieri]
MGTGIDQSNEQGIIPRFAHSLFERMLDVQSKRSNHTFQLYASFLELYNEDIHDLLITTELSHQHHEHPTIREDMDGKIYWAGIREERIYSVEDLMRCLKNGSQKRTTGSTEMNTSSSRSHAIFSIMLKQQITHHDNAASALAEDNDDDDITALIGNRTTLPQRLVSKFHFVDLAGSERLKRTHAMGDRQKEGIFINGGLLALGNVISALGDDSSRKPQYVPYRDSKLTRLLQDSLGGNSHTLMLACVSASSSDYTETLNTLKYANRARNIQNRVQINQDFVEGGSPEESLYLRLQIARLKNQLHMLKQVHHHDITVQDLKQEMQQIKSFSQQIAHELAEATSARDTLLLGKDEPVESHPIIQQYAHQIQQLRLQIAETRSSSNSNSSSNNSKSRDLIPSLPSKPSSFPRPKVSSSMGFLGDTLFVDNNSNITKKHQGSVSSGRRLTSKKKPVVQRMKTQSSPSSKRKQQQAHHDMDELFKLLRIEYSAPCEQFKSTDETVLHASHASTERATVSTTTTAATPTGTTAANPMHDNVCEAEDNKKVFPDTQSQHFMPADICPPNSTFEDDELEALAVPSWSDAPKLPSVNGSIKRKSISLDSMWDDTDSSMTTSRVDNQSPTHHHQQQQQHHQKEIRRSSKNLLKMLHQIQADLLVKRELVGQLERSEDQYTQMRVNYESRLNELKDHLLEIQNQRDAALRQSGTSIVASHPQQLPKRPQSVLQLRENRQAQEVRSQYEQKIKRLIQENAELRKKTTQSTQSIQTARAKAEGTIGRLRADIEALKLDKKQLHRSLKLEADKAREASANHEREMAQLKRRVLVAFDAKKKLEDTNEAQQQVITKRNQETLAANMQLRHLTTVLRRAANEGTFLNESALDKILADASASAATAIQLSSASNYNSKPAAAVGVAGRSRMQSPPTTGL